ncbi:MAG: hypothetical protein D6705_18235 [Deltaproteobacteria bacterium]|nr:MAG: hypothetical protein D6705_18235 [Deltaproteobacteria bacterium]
MDPTILGRDFRTLVDGLERADGISTNGRDGWEPWPDGLSVADLVAKEPTYAKVPSEILEFARAAGYLRAYLEWWEGGPEDKPSSDDEGGAINFSVAPLSPTQEGDPLHEAGYTAQGPSFWRIDEISVDVVEDASGAVTAVDSMADGDPEVSPAELSPLAWLGRAIATAGLEISFDAETLEEERSFYDSLDDWQAARLLRRIRELGIVPAETARRYYPELVDLLV